jgi:hypothetical protein
MFPLCDVSYNTMKILIMYLTLLVEFFESDGQLDRICDCLLTQKYGI